MDTVDLPLRNGGVLEVPEVAAEVAGQPVALDGWLAPHKCQHTGAHWSSDLELRCPWCGIRLFLPPRFLAFRHALTAEWMERAWSDAGCPPWCGGDWGQWGINPDPWSLNPKFWHMAAATLPAEAYPLDWWVMQQVSGFEDMGGLPVRASRLETFVEKHGTALRSAAVLPR